MSYILTRQQAEAEASEYWEPRYINAEQEIADTLFRAQAAFEDAMRAYNRNSTVAKIDIQGVADAFHDYLPSPDFIQTKLAELTPPQRN